MSGQGASGQGASGQGASGQGASGQGASGDARRYPGQSLGLPEEEFDYDDYVKREFGEKSPKPRGLSWFWWVVAVFVLGAFLKLFFHL